LRVVMVSFLLLVLVRSACVAQVGAELAELRRIRRNRHSMKTEARSLRFRPVNPDSPFRGDGAAGRISSFQGGAG